MIVRVQSGLFGKFVRGVVGYAILGAFTAAIFTVLGLMANIAAPFLLVFLIFTAAFALGRAIVEAIHTVGVLRGIEAKKIPDSSLWKITNYYGKSWVVGSGKEYNLPADLTAKEKAWTKRDIASRSFKAFVDSKKYAGHEEAGKGYENQRAMLQNGMFAASIASAVMLLFKGLAFLGVTFVAPVASIPLLYVVIPAALLFIIAKDTFKKVRSDGGVSNIFSEKGVVRGISFIFHILVGIAYHLLDSFALQYLRLPIEYYWLGANQERWLSDVEIESIGQSNREQLAAEAQKTPLKRIFTMSLEKTRVGRWSLASYRASLAAGLVEFIQKRGKLVFLSAIGGYVLPYIGTHLWAYGAFSSGALGLFAYGSYKDWRDLSRAGQVPTRGWIWKRVVAGSVMALILDGLLFLGVFQWQWLVPVMQHALPTGEVVSQVVPAGVFNLLDLGQIIHTPALGFIKEQAFHFTVRSFSSSGLLAFLLAVTAQFPQKVSQIMARNLFHDIAHIIGQEQAKHFALDSISLKGVLNLIKKVDQSNEFTPEQKAHVLLILQSQLTKSDFLRRDAFGLNRSDHAIAKSAVGKALKQVDSAAVDTAMGQVIQVNPQQQITFEEYLTLVGSRRYSQVRSQAWRELLFGPRFWVTLFFSTLGMWFVGHEISMIVGYSEFLDSLTGVPIISTLVKSIEGDRERQERIQVLEHWGAPVDLGERLRAHGALGLVNNVTQAFLVEPFHQYVVMFKTWRSEQTTKELLPSDVPAPAGKIPPLAAPAVNSPEPPEGQAPSDQVPPIPPSDQAEPPADQGGKPKPARGVPVPGPGADTQPDSIQPPPTPSPISFNLINGFTASFSAFKNRAYSGFIGFGHEVFERIKEKAEDQFVLAERTHHDVVLQYSDKIEKDIEEELHERLFTNSTEAAQRLYGAQRDVAKQFVHHYMDFLEKQNGGRLSQATEAHYRNALNPAITDAVAQNVITEEDAILFRMYFDQMIDSRFGKEKPQEKPKISELATTSQLPLHPNLNHLTFQEVAEQALVYRVLTREKVEQIYNANKKLLESQRGLTLQFILRGEAGLAGAGGAVGFEVEFYLYDATKQKRFELAKDTRSYNFTLERQDVLDTVNEAARLTNNYIRAVSEQQNLKSTLQKIEDRRLEELVKQREDLDLYGIRNVADLKRYLEQKLKNVDQFVSDTETRVADLTGATGYRISLDPQLTQSSFYENPKAKEEMFDGITKKILSQYGIQIEPTAEWKLPELIAKNKYEVRRSTLALNDLKGHSILFDLRALFRFGPNFNFNQPFFFERHKGLAPGVMDVQSTRNLVFYNRDLNGIENRLSDLEKRIPQRAARLRNSEAEYELAQQALDQNLNLIEKGGPTDSLIPVFERFLRADLTLEDARQNIVADNIELRQMTAALNDASERLNQDIEDQKIEKNLLDVQIDDSPIEIVSQGWQADIMRGFNWNAYHEQLNQRETKDVAANLIVESDKDRFLFFSWQKDRTKPLEKILDRQKELYKKLEHPKTSETRKEQIEQELKELEEKKYKLVDQYLNQIMLGIWQKEVQQVAKELKTEKDPVNRKILEARQEFLLSELKKASGIKDLALDGQNRLRSFAIETSGDRSHIGTGIKLGFEIGRKLDGDFEVLYQTLERSRHLEIAHKREFAENAQKSEWIIHHIHERIEGFTQRRATSEKLIEQLKKNLANPALASKKDKIQASLTWTQMELKAIEEAYRSLSDELERAIVRYKQTLGLEVKDKVIFNHFTALDYTTPPDQIRKELEAAVPEFDPGIAEKIVRDDVWIQWGVRKAAHQTGTLRGEVIAQVLNGGFGSQLFLEVADFNRSRQVRIDRTIADGNLRKAWVTDKLHRYRQMALHEQIRITQDNTRIQYKDSMGVVRKNQTRIEELEAKDRAGTLSRDRDSERIKHEARVNLLATSDDAQLRGLSMLLESQKSAMIAGSWVSFYEGNPGDPVTADPNHLSDISKSVIDPIANENANLAGQLYEAHKQFRFLSPLSIVGRASISTVEESNFKQGPDAIVVKPVETGKIIKFPASGKGETEESTSFDARASVEAAYVFSQLFSDQSTQIAKLTSAQLGLDCDWRDFSTRRVVDATGRDMFRDKTNRDVTQKQLARRENFLEQIKLTASSDTGILQDFEESIERKKAEAESSEGAFEIGKSKYRAINSWHPEREIIFSDDFDMLAFPEVDLKALEETEAEIIELATRDPRYKAFLPNAAIFELRRKQAEQERLTIRGTVSGGISSKEGLFPNASIELRRDLINEERDVEIKLERLQKELAESQTRSVFNDVLSQLLGERLALVRSLAQLNDLLEDYILANEHFDNLKRAYLDPERNGGIKPTREELARAFDNVENVEFKLVQVKYEYLKSLDNFRSALKLLGSKYAAQLEKITYQNPEYRLSDELQKARQQERVLAGVINQSEKNLAQTKAVRNFVAGQHAFFEVLKPQEEEAVKRDRLNEEVRTKLTDAVGPEVFSPEIKIQPGNQYLIGPARKLASDLFSAELIRPWDGSTDVSDAAQIEIIKLADLADPVVFRLHFQNKLVADVILDVPREGVKLEDLRRKIDDILERANSLVSVGGHVTLKDKESRTVAEGLLVTAGTQENLPGNLTVEVKIDEDLKTDAFTAQSFARMFDLMGKADNHSEREILITLELIKRLQGLEDDQGQPDGVGFYVNNRLKNLIEMIPKIEQLGFDWDQPLLLALKNSTQIQISLDDATETDKKIDLRVLGIYRYFSMMLLANAPEIDSDLSIEQAVDLILKENPEFPDVIRLKMIVLELSLLERLKYLEDKPQDVRGFDFEQWIKNHPPDFDFLKQSSLFTKAVKEGERRLSYSEWKASYPGKSDADFLKFVLMQELIYGNRDLSDRNRSKFLTDDDFLAAFIEMREIIKELYRKYDNTTLALYGNIDDFSDITAWEFLSRSGVLYEENKEVRHQIMKNIVWIVKKLIENKAILYDRLHPGGYTDEYLAQLPRSGVIRLMADELRDPNLTPGQKNTLERMRTAELDKVRTGLFMGETISITLTEFERYEQRLDKKLNEFIPEDLVLIYQSIDDFYHTAPKIKQVLDQADLYDRPIDFENVKDRGVISAWYDYLKRWDHDPANDLALGEFEVVIKVASELKKAVEAFRGEALDARKSKDIGVLLAHAGHVIGYSGWDRAYRDKDPAALKELAYWLDIDIEDRQSLYREILKVAAKIQPNVETVVGELDVEAEDGIDSGILMSQAKHVLMLSGWDGVRRPEMEKWARALGIKLQQDGFPEFQDLLQLDAARLNERIVLTNDILVKASEAKSKEEAKGILRLVMQ
ncbi:MAG: hypothetical protein HY351_00005, partial [Candidatus Omnitrophica bacterium]|nr:hypothetical protein [Candidatus Omnitrophota bacterium]